MANILSADLNCVNSCPDKKSGRCASIFEQIVNAAFLLKSNQKNRKSDLKLSKSIKKCFKTQKCVRPHPDGLTFLLLFGKMCSSVYSALCKHAFRRYTQTKRPPKHGTPDGNRSVRRSVSFLFVYILSLSFLMHSGQIFFPL